MNLYQVIYYTWNMDFSDAIIRKKLSIGTSQEDAISKVKEVVDSDARGFMAVPIEEVMGYKIIVSEKNT